MEASQSKTQCKRTLKDGPWCWQNKHVMKQITETFAETNKAPSARSVMVALTEIASDEQSETFTVSKALIAHKAGVSVKTAERMLAGLEQLGVVQITRDLCEPSPGAGAIKSPNTYTLLPIRLNDAMPMRHHGKHTSKSDKVEESGKISEERGKNARNGLRPHRETLPDGFDSALPDGFDEDEKFVIGLYHLMLAEPNPQWRRVDQFSAEVRKAIRDFLAAFRGSKLSDFHTLFKTVRDGDEAVHIPKTKTFVRLVRDNRNFVNEN